MGYERQRAEDYMFVYGKGSENHRIGTGFFVHERKYWQLRQ